MNWLIGICGILFGGAFGLLIGFRVGKKAMLKELTEKEI